MHLRYFIVELTHFPGLLHNMLNGFFKGVQLPGDGGGNLSTEV